MYLYSKRIFEGDGVTRSNAATNYWVKQAAEKGHSLAQAHYSGSLFQGIGTDRAFKTASTIYKQAYYWADRSARQGSPAGYYMRAQLVWPTEYQEMASLIKAGKILLGVFNVNQALADIRRADATCKRAPYSSQELYKPICEKIALVRPVILKDAQNARAQSVRSDDEYYRKKSQDQWNQNQQEILKQQQFENDMAGQGMGW